MSLLNVWIEPERALVGVDTATMFVDPAGKPLAVEGTPVGTRLEVSKMLPIAHLNAILAARGTGILLPQVYLVCHAQLWVDLDRLLDAMPTILDQCFSGLDNTGRAMCMAPLDPLQEVLLVGWSKSAGRMRGVMFVQEQRADGFVANEIDAVWIAPWDDGAQGVPVDPAGYHCMTELMRSQVADARTRFPGVPVGGRGLIAEITRNGLQIEEACSFDD